VDGVTWQVYGQDLEQNLVDVTETSFAETVQGSGQVSGCRWIVIEGRSSKGMRSSGSVGCERLAT